MLHHVKGFSSIKLGAILTDTDLARVCQKAAADAKWQSASTSTDLTARLTFAQWPRK